MTQELIERLEPCPFCGNAEPFMRYEWQICCGQHGTSETTCACEGPFANSEVEAIAAWNTRPPVVTDEVVELLKRIYLAGHSEGWTGNQQRRDVQHVDAEKGWSLYVKNGALAAMPAVVSGGQST